MVNATSRDGSSRSSGGSSRTTGAWQALAVLVFALVVSFPDVLFGSRTLSAAAWVPGVLPGGPVGSRLPPGAIAPRDPEGAAWVDEPAPYLVHAALAAGRAPLWNDREGLGLPLLGNPNTAALAPLQWPVEVRPGARMQDLAWLARALVLGAFTWLLARRIGCGSTGAVVAAGAIMLSGQTVEWITHHPLHTDAFVPLALAAAIGLPADGRRGIALLAAAVAAGLLAVKPQSAVVAGACGLVWIVAQGMERGDRLVGRPTASLGARLVACAVALAAGALAASVALVPFAETWRQSSALVRAGRSSQSEWTLPPGSAVSLLGRLAVAPRATAPTVGGATPPAGLPWVGAGVLAAAVAGSVRARRRPLAWALVATSALLMARIHGFLPVPLAGVPIAGSIQFVKYCFPLYLALALLAGLAFPPASEEALAAPRAWLRALAAAAILAELAWNCHRPRPVRVPLWTPAPWVEALRSLQQERPGRISGPVDLAPPLVSAALGFRDLRSIDVLTPADTWRSVQEIVAPSRGVTWMVADPDPLIAATSAGAAAADLRWILARRPLLASDLPGATRTAIVARRLVALFADLDRWQVEGSGLSGGLDAFAGEERFHWTCVAPCRLHFDLRRLPRWFTVGFAGPEAATVVVRLAATSASGRRAETTEAVPLATQPPSWRDVRVAAPEGEAGRPGRVDVAIESDRPVQVFAGGVGPAMSEAEERLAASRELAWREAALRSLALRWSGPDAAIYENPGALGSAWMARGVIVVDDDEAVLDCVRSHPGEPVACVSSSDVLTLGDRWPRESSGRLSVVDDDAGRTSAEVETDGGGVAVFSRLFQPGWRATIDGRPAPLVRVGGGLSAVPVPGGSHRVEVAYRPASVLLGAALSAVGAIVIGWFAIGDRRR